jgi:hypothetical protein
LKSFFAPGSGTSKPSTASSEPAWRPDLVIRDSSKASRKTFQETRTAKRKRRASASSESDHSDRDDVLENAFGAQRGWPVPVEDDKDS